jgi:hypothetical protein
VVKGAGMALVLLFTAAADLAKDLAVRLVGLGAILACLGLLCRGKVGMYLKERERTES